MVIVKDLSSTKALFTFDAAAQLSIALTMKFDVPGAEGTPVIEPVSFIFRPGGNVPDTILNFIGNCPPEIVN